MEALHLWMLSVKSIEICQVVLHVYIGSLKCEKTGGGTDALKNFEENLFERTCIGQMI